MTEQNFTTTIAVDQTPEAAFAAITNARGWWSEEIDGRTDRLGVFDYSFKDIHRCKIQITELVPGKTVTWHVLENYFSFTKDKTREWADTTINFAIAKKGDKTEIRFTHLGLVPEYECYDVCSDGWSTYINASLRSLIATGKGHPNAGEAITDSERALTR